MKFLLLVKNRPGPPPAENQLELLKAARAYLQTMLAEGVLDCVYQYGTGRQGVAIANFDSAEELWERLTAYPLYPVQDYEVFPLADLDLIFEKTFARLQA